MSVFKDHMKSKYITFLQNNTARINIICEQDLQTQAHSLYGFFFFFFQDTSLSAKMP